MPFIPLRNFGKYGVIADTPSQALPVGTWSDARNVRFTGMQVEKMLEPSLEVDLTGIGEGDDVDVVWYQGWSDGRSSYIAAATKKNLWFLSRTDENDIGTWVKATRAMNTEGGTLEYSPEGRWQSFAWGDTCVFNNGADVPQVFNLSSLKFVDMPKWGLTSSATDLTNDDPPSDYTAARCTIMVPVRNFLVACGVTDKGKYQPNKVWWSDATSLATLNSNDVGGGPPSWDYESPATLSGQSEIDPESGEIKSAALLNENLIIYTDAAATAMAVVGGTFVMNFRRLFNKGAAGLNTVAEFNNQHFVVATDQMYIHDGSTVQLIAKDRVEEEFFVRVGKGGRYGSGTVDWDSVQVFKNPDRKEISVVYGGNYDDTITAPPVIVSEPGPR